MAYVAVIKNEQGQYEVVKYLTSLYNQRSPITQVTIGNISYLDASGRLEHGFWLSEDVYIGTGEFREFDIKEVKFDDVEGKVTNTYTYKLMDLDVIREEMKNRVRSYRSQLANGEYKHGEHVFDISHDGRCELHGYIIESLLDQTIEIVSIRLPNGEDVNMSMLELKELYLSIAAYRDGLFDKEAEIIDAINAANDYDSIRSAAVWDEHQL
ncbi:hypothetical protein AAGG91_003006 [Salmonella enterica]|nr:hypothetical protein [Salmonella enterica subsp. enterica serovar Mbandaka]